LKKELTLSIIHIMRTENLTIAWQEYSVNELNQSDRLLVESAKEATKSSYSPYSGFKVGAAVLLGDGSIVNGSNQENTAYPSGLCAERVAIFSAGASKPEQPVTAIAIAAYHNGHFTEIPITPCGACRQVMMETEFRSGKPIRIILSGERKIMVFESGINQLLPFCFGADSLK
jgi:cytidine deaminase